MRGNRFALFVGAALLAALSSALICAMLCCCFSPGQGCGHHRLATAQPIAALRIAAEAEYLAIRCRQDDFDDLCEALTTSFASSAPAPLDILAPSLQASPPPARNAAATLATLASSADAARLAAEE